MRYVDPTVATEVHCTVVYDEHDWKHESTTDYETTTHCCANCGKYRYRQLWKHEQYYLADNKTEAWSPYSHGTNTARKPYQLEPACRTLPRT